MPHLLIDATGHVMVLHILDPETSVEAEINKIAAAKPDLSIVSVKEVSPEAVPSDRTFRDAWRHCQQNGIRHCLETAKNIHRDTIRRRRKQRFDETDVALGKAFATRRDASAVLAMVDALKDAPAHESISSATSIDELKSAWPDVLEQRVPELGGPVAAGEAPAYDTKALENWASALNEKISRLEAANTGGIQRDLQKIMSRVDDIATSHSSRIDDLTKLIELVAHHAAVKGMADIITEEVQQ